MIISPIVNAVEYILDPFEPDMLQYGLLATIQGTSSTHFSAFKVQKFNLSSEQIRVSLRWISLLYDLHAGTKQGNWRIYTKCDKRTESQDISYLDSIWICKHISRARLKWRTKRAPRIRRFLGIVKLGRQVFVHLNRECGIWRWMDSSTCAS